MTSKTFFTSPKIPNNPPTGASFPWMPLLAIIVAHRLEPALGLLLCGAMLAMSLIWTRVRSMILLAHVRKISKTARLTADRQKTLARTLERL